MQTTIGKWGASCAVRIPKAFVNMLGLHDGVPITFSVEKNALIIKPSDTQETLADLVAQAHELSVPAQQWDEHDVLDSEWPTH